MMHTLCNKYFVIFFSQEHCLIFFPSQPKNYVHHLDVFISFKHPQHFPNEQINLSVDPIYEQ